MIKMQSVRPDNLNKVQPLFSKTVFTVPPCMTKSIQNLAVSRASESL